VGAKRRMLKEDADIIERDITHTLWKGTSGENVKFSLSRKRMPCTFREMRNYAENIENFVLMLPYTYYH
jgi:hypothetical protein